MTVSDMHIRVKVYLDKIDSEAYPEILPEEIDLYLNEAQLRFIKTRYGYNNPYGKGFEQSQKRVDDLKNLVTLRFASVTPEASYVDMGMNIYRAQLDNLYNDVAHTTPSTEDYMFFLKGSVGRTRGTCSDWQMSKQIQQDDIFAITADPFNRPTNIPLIFFEDSDICVWVPDDTTVNNFSVSFIRKPSVISYTGNTTNTIRLVVRADATDTSITLSDGTIAEPITITGGVLTTDEIATAIDTAITTAGLAFDNVVVAGNVVTISSTQNISYLVPINLNVTTTAASVDCELSEHTHEEIVQMAVQIILENIESQRSQTQEALNVRKME